MTPDAQILFLLHRSPQGVAAAVLAQRANLNPADLAGRIEQLRALGYDIESTPHLGLRLVRSPDALHADDLLARLAERRIVGRDIQVFQQTDSTNDVAEKLARDGVPEGVVVFAEAQTKGRGRFGRRWLSPAGAGLWFSVLLRPALPVASVTQITIASATAVARAIRKHTGLVPQVKWPNDILIRQKKVVGILTEMSAEMDRVRHVVLGIGVDVNVTEFPPELQNIATSLALETGQRIKRPELAAAILSELDADYERVLGGQFSTLAEEWEEQCATLGRRVEVVSGHRRLCGRAESLDSDGALLLRTDHGHLERVVGGEVQLQN
jgi:BirA family transcriptional regulator, biotin operon repressor / biotin---[acetyl-CoA-carboxylase] ligase